jgi:LacI family transcriptional regulator
MGFDNIDTLQYVNPKLSTIYNSVEEVAKTSVNLLFDLINGMEVEKEKILGYVAIDGETL